MKEEVTKVRKENVTLVEKPSKEEFLETVAELTAKADVAQEEVVEEYQFPPIDLLSKPVIKNVAKVMIMMACCYFRVKKICS